MFSIGQYISQQQLGSKDGSTSVSASSETQVVVKAPQPLSTSGKDYTKLLRDGSNESRDIKASIDDLKPLVQRHGKMGFPKPSEEEVRACTERTRKALDAVLKEKLSKGKPNTARNKPTYLKYTTSDFLTGDSTSRIMKIVDVQQDPMAPPKFKQKKQVARPPSPPAPVLHAPPRKATAEEQKEWYIPPAVSNWKNPNGYTIALDKRLAVDGRDPTRHQTDTINQRSVDLADALDQEEKNLREEIKIRNSMKKQLAEKESREKEEKLRLLAHKAREQRYIKHDSIRSDEFDDPGARQRAIIREERRRKAEKELKMSRMGREQKIKQMSRALGDRDVSERVQLGLAKPTKSVENEFDSRLFTKSAQITNSEDQVYDNPLFVQQAVNSIYTVSESNLNLQNDPDQALSEMQNEKRFDTLSSTRQGPVEFEREEKIKEQSIDEDYGLIAKKRKLND